jgi:hypothetical protein
VYLAHILDSPIAVDFDGQHFYYITQNTMIPRRLGNVRYPPSIGGYALWQSNEMMFA